MGAAHTKGQIGRVNAAFRRRLLSFLGALIEVFQNIPSLHRDCDWKDWVADTLAIAVALLLCEALRRLAGQHRAAPAA